MDDYKFELAMNCHEHGLNDQAIDYLKELLSQDPENAAAHGLLASCLVSTKRIYAAEYELSIAMQLDPEQSHFHLVLARIELLKNKPQQALLHCDEALRLESQQYFALLLKSDLYLLLGKPEQALRHIDLAASIAPDTVDVLTAYGDYHLGQSDKLTAMRFAQDAMQIDPQDDSANLLMGRLQLLDGNYAEAEYHAKFVISQNPDSEEALNLFCNIKARRNWFLGFWWRANAKLGTKSNLVVALVLIAAYIFFNLVSQIASDLDYQQSATLISYGWLAIVVYSWVGIPMYNRQLEKELKKFSFRSDF